MANYPAGTYTPSAVSDGDTINASRDNAQDAEITAIENELRTAGLTNVLLVNAGIQFPEPQVVSTDAHTLDDYEEFTWTPTIGGTGGESGQVYSEQLGQFVKIGRLVCASFRVTLSTLGTITTAAQIEGLPYAIANVSAGSFGSFDLGFQALTSNAIRIIGVPVVNTTTITLFIHAAAGTTSFSAAVVQSDLSNTTNLRGQFWYLSAT